MSDWLAWLETLSPQEIDLGLERVQAVLARLLLDMPESVLLVAGTNGKGSSVQMAQSLLLGAGYRVGAYTSPHVIDYNERIAVDGRNASDPEIIAAFERVEASRNGLPLTYFEFGTLAAMVIFAAAELDVWILEIGMGGRLDACNAVQPSASLITNVALDHCEWLGNDVETIAVEKAGVMRPGIPTVFGSRNVPAALLQHAAASGADLLLGGRDFDYARSADGRWDWTGRHTERLALPAPGLPGEFQFDNAAAVLALLEAAGLDRALDAALLRRVLPSLRLTGRMQSVRAGGVDWLLDVAHNPAAAAALAHMLTSAAVAGQTWAIIGLLDDKDVEGIAAALDPALDRFIAVAATSPRALPVEELARRIANACGRPCRISESLDEALRYARRGAGKNDRVLVTGSFYLVGPALQALELYSRSES